MSPDPNRMDPTPPILKEVNIARPWDEAVNVIAQHYREPNGVPLHGRGSGGEYRDQLHPTWFFWV